jgi:hypothetical protein
MELQQSIGFAACRGSPNRNSRLPLPVYLRHNFSIDWIDSDQSADRLARNRWIGLSADDGTRKPHNGSN